MSRYFPQAEYAEDQASSGTILTTHVYHRGFQSGAFVGILFSFTRAVIRRRRHPDPKPSIRALLRPNVLRSAGVGGIIGTGLMVAALPMRMNGREDIEWQDRAWRLLENKTQVRTDDFSIIGSAVGGAGAGIGLARGTLPATGPVGKGLVFLGGVGAGSLVGVVSHILTGSF